jgi:hypothetical protein
MRPSPAPNGKCHERMTWQQPSHRANCTPAKAGAHPETNDL